MLNVLIADDESKVCQLIEKLVDWPSLGMQVVAKFRMAAERNKDFFIVFSKNLLKDVHKSIMKELWTENNPTPQD